MGRECCLKVFCGTLKVREEIVIQHEETGYIKEGLQAIDKVKMCLSKLTPTYFKQTSYKRLIVYVNAST